MFVSFQCHRGKSLDAFFEGIQSTPVRLAVVGCGCSVATEPVAEISYRWNISQVWCSIIELYIMHVCVRWNARAGWSSYDFAYGRNSEWVIAMDNLMCIAFLGLILFSTVKLCWCKKNPQKKQQKKTQPTCFP